MLVRNEEAWEKLLAENSEKTWENGILKFAERWANRMEGKLDRADSDPETFGSIVEMTMDKDEKGLYLRNSQLSLAIAVLVKHWKYGEALERWRKERWLAVRAGRDE